MDLKCRLVQDRRILWMATQQLEVAEVAEALRSGWITTGPKCAAFEQAFADRLQSPSALAMSSCTAALHTALVILGIGPGDEVITSTMTFCSTVSVIEHVGATPVLVDVEPDTLNLDPRCVAEAVTPRTRAIIPVHYAGHPCDMDAIEAIANKHDLFIVEDAAQRSRRATRTAGSARATTRPASASTPPRTSPPVRAVC